MEYNIDMKKISSKRGFMQIILLAIVTIAALAYFNIDLRTIFENPILQKIGSIFVVAWSEFIKPLIVYLYTSIYGLFN